ncbi:hypothetical protein RXV86_14885 [Alisedimentitalea sp. MJ-SS2]|uniref:hypothetical protein n=1 Tax=Aliisedimentitalea sp. MJ-SS2 TaxID=3049795 RepID=UPI0029144144|nr:hypothetical protein [Alisedimentitalea sp. MJ-SS2]MDU8928675.1 hypothetical protein [Alisedimentitalea sp. MJ-SS2]
MLGGQKSFDKRLHGINKAHRRAPKRAAYVVNANGTIAARRTRKGPNISIKGILYLALGLALFKSIAMAQFGLPVYTERVEALRQGTFVEQAGAVVMQPDRISILIAGQIAPYLR